MKTGAEMWKDGRRGEVKDRWEIVSLKQIVRCGVKKTGEIWRENNWGDVGCRFCRKISDGDRERDVG